MPGYIGYSSREGSGIFDPVKNAGTEYCFYNLQDNLEIDTASLFQLIKENENNILLLVHYFGFSDPKLTEIKEFAREKNMTIIEDCAHAFFTFFKKPVIDSDYYIFSLHKMFPYSQGGMLLSKTALQLEDAFDINPFEYNLYAISNARVQNYNYLLERLASFDEIKILKPSLEADVPQTLPILVASEEIRDNLYFKLNELGFGVVSLYHELIGELSSKEHPNEFYLAAHILNMPIHQDVTLEDIDKMIEAVTTHKLLKS